jgi:hypothetical protein
MPDVVVRAAGCGTVLLRSGESLAFGRAPHGRSGPGGPGRVVLAIPDCAPHVSRLVGELEVGAERAMLHWLGSGAAQLAGLFDAPGGARRVSLTRSMSAPLDDGENQLVLLLGRLTPGGGLADLVIDIGVTPTRTGRAAGADATGPGTADTKVGPALERYSREWFVALALAEPWLVGRDDYPRPPSNKEIFERVRDWHGYAWNLGRPQRVDEAIRVVSAVAFGPRDDPFGAPHEGRLQNVRFAVARRAAELQLVTAADLGEVVRAARMRKLPPPQASSAEPSSS